MKRFVAVFLTLFVFAPVVAQDPVQVEQIGSDAVATDSVVVQSVEMQSVDGPFEQLGPIEVVSAPAPVSQHRGYRSDIMQVRNYSMLDFRRMFMRHRAPTSAELAGTWRGVNKGIVRLAGVKQFVKQIQPCGPVMFGDNVDVHQVSDDMLRCAGWQPKVDRRTGMLKRNGKYMVQRPNFRGPFGHGVTFSYRDGGNRRGDFRRVIVDKVVLIDPDHLLGRASVRVGFVQIPVGYFVLERMY